MISRFNIRVYGILINEKNEVLVADELIKGAQVTKFPGGGLEFGEGAADCLKREFMEETGNEIEIVEHLYTTDFFQVSAYNPSHQIISIYYIVNPTTDFSITTTDRKFNFTESADNTLAFRWVGGDVISENEFTLPIDKVVGKLLAERFRKK